jgi:hypothetical protein
MENSMNEISDICNELESLGRLSTRTSAYIRQLEAELAATKNSLVHAHIELQALKANPAGNNAPIESSELLSKFNETVALCGDADKFKADSALRLGCYAYFIHGTHQVTPPSSPIMGPLTGVDFSLAGPGVPEINPGPCFSVLLKASRNVLSWIEAKHRPPINDFCGGMALVRLHALADLKAAVDKIDQK